MRCNGTHTLHLRARCIAVRLRAAIVGSYQSRLAKNRHIEHFENVEYSNKYQCKYMVNRGIIQRKHEKPQWAPSGPFSLAQASAFFG